MKKNIEIVMLGDSITGRGQWKELLENEHLLNLGVDADTTLGVLSRVNPVLELDAKVVFLMIGINDLCVSVPLEEVFENYKKIVEKLSEKNIRLVAQALFLTQMPAVNKKVLLFNEMIKKLCHEKSIEFLDLNDSFKNEEGLLREDLTTDGLHLGQKAYKAWAYKINKFLKIGE